MASTSIITNSPNSNVKGSTLQAGAKINLLLFKSENDLNKFLESLGISGALTNSGDIPILSTYIKAFGLGLLSRNLRLHTTDFDNYLKRNHSAKFTFGPENQLLVVFAADNWQFLAKKSITAGQNYTVTTIRGSWGRHSATIIPS